VRAAPAWASHRLLAAERSSLSLSSHLLQSQPKQPKPRLINSISASHPPAKKTSTHNHLTPNHAQAFKEVQAQAAAASAAGLPPPGSVAVQMTSPAGYPAVPATTPPGYPSGAAAPAAGTPINYPPVAGASDGTREIKKGKK